MLALALVAVPLALLASAPLPPLPYGARPAPPDAPVGAERGSRNGPGGHGEGLKLAASAEESVTPGSRCRAGAPVRRHDVAAIAVDITVNRYLDHDPRGRMYVLAGDVDRIRAEEAANQAARSGAGDPAVSLGLQGDWIQPLTLRAHPGDCLRIGLRNQLDEPASLHLHGSQLRVAGTDAPAVATNPRATAAPGQAVEYEWAIPGDEPEGTHYFHSHGVEREQTAHGLFGALIVEPPGSTWLDPRTGAPATGWDAIIKDPQGSDFREFALYYHEIGDETYLLRDAAGGFVPQVDPLTQAYRPDGRALNYRSEPFLNRLRLQQERQGRFDESLEYSSYAFGDPATPVLRAYLGEPTKQRVIHGGSEVFHVHHVHGGAVRWRRQSGAEPSAFDSGLDKHPPVRSAASERTDSQSIGPSETFDVTDECGAGGCQQAAGDFLYHCHIGHHYFAGMWGIWRVYNTLQDGASTDALPPLLPLPDRDAKLAPAVPSDRLVGTDVAPTSADLAALVEAQLPPPGVPRGYDASVLDWRREGDVYLNEPETGETWPGFGPTAPGKRLAILFDPRTGRLAYPFLRPHLGKRPPFAPNHGPAPFLDPKADGTDPPAPGANGPASVCPAGARLKPMAINAITLPIALNERSNLVDPAGQLFVLRSEQDAVRADNRLRVPLAIRANAGEDCVDVVLRSELADSAETPFSKVGLHIHFVQFDPQASDGVTTGFNYEQTVRPFAAEGQTLAEPVEPGATTIVVGAADRFQPGVVVGVGLDQDATFEVARIAAIDGNRLTLRAPLRFGHRAGEVVGTEFVRYRWYPDAQFGTSYFHDHVNALVTWQHGLFGALVAEPPGSTYTDPMTGEPLSSGPVADIHTSRPVSVDVRGSFRELVLFTQDDQPLTHVGRSTGGALNLRAEPLGDQGRSGDPSLLFSSLAHGDPVTPVLNAYLGDPMVVRNLVGASNEVHTLHVDGHWFRAEPFSPTSPPISTIQTGVSERYDLVIPSAGGPQRMPGDYLYYNGRTFKLREGSWGIARVHGPGGGAGLRRLPGHEQVPAPATSVCPADAPLKRFSVTAISTPLEMLGGDDGKLFVLSSEKEAVRSGRKAPEPLALHVAVGDCVEITLTNETSDGAVSYSCDLLASDPARSAGVAAGNLPSQAVAPGASRTYTYYASPEVGETVALGRDWGDVLENPGLGLYGAIVVGPRGAAFRDPATGADLAAASSWKVDVVPPDGQPYRDFTVFLQDEDESIGTHRMPYSAKVRGPVAINYGVADESGAGTPVLEARAGDLVRVHVLAPWSEQAGVFSIEGHRWPVEPGRSGTPLVSSVRVGGLESLTLRLDGGAGGPERLAGDYTYGDHRLPYKEAGRWGLFRVMPHDGEGPLPLMAAKPRPDPAVLAGLGMMAVVGSATVLLVRNQRRTMSQGQRR